jgi:hypothetical protein
MRRGEAIDQDRSVGSPGREKYLPFTGGCVTLPHRQISDGPSRSSIEAIRIRRQYSRRSLEFIPALGGV